MISEKIGKRSFALFGSKITNESYGATIKKLTFAQQKVFVQLLPARLVAGKNHVFIALEHAISALESGSSITKTLELEFLVHFFGNRQVEKAFESAKFEPGEDLVLVIEVKDAKGAKKILQELSFTEQRPKFGSKKYIMDFYNISEKELEALSDKKDALESLVVERISLIGVTK